MNYDDNILKVKAEFINTLKKDFEKRLDKKVNQKEIMRSTQYFILKKVFEKMECKEEIKKEHWEIFCGIIDFCLKYGFVIVDTLNNLEMQEVSKDVEA